MVEHLCHTDLFPVLSRKRTEDDYDDEDEDERAPLPVVKEAREDKKNLSALDRVKHGLHNVKVQYSKI